MTWVVESAILFGWVSGLAVDDVIVCGSLGWPVVATQLCHARVRSGRMVAAWWKSRASSESSVEERMDVHE